MASPAQITANQVNAQSSTGPRSPQGKAVSSQNGLRHGFRSQCVVIPGEDPAEFEALRQSMIERYAPQTASETAQVDIMIACTWRLLRIPRLETAIFAQCEDPAEAFVLHAKSFSTLIRYQNSTQRAYDHAAKELQSLQEARAFTPEPRIGFARQTVQALPESPREPEPPAPQRILLDRKGNVTVPTPPPLQKNIPAGSMYP